MHSELEAKKAAITIEKENETAILRHQCEMKQRLRDLTEESLGLENKQALLTEKLNTFVSENERIRIELLKRDRCGW